MTFLSSDRLLSKIHGVHVLLTALSFFLYDGLVFLPHCPLFAPLFLYQLKNDRLVFGHAAEPLSLYLQ